MIRPNVPGPTPGPGPSHASPPMKLLGAASLVALCLAPSLVIRAGDGPARDAPPAAERVDEANPTFRYRGLTVNIAALVDLADPAPALASLRHQIDMVADARVKPEIARFFRLVPIVLGTVGNGSPGVGLPGPVVLLTAAPIDPEWRVLIHELLHAYYSAKLTPAQEREIVRFHQEALTAYEWDKDEYFLSDCQEFFAVTGSIYLRGKIGRPPHDRPVIRKAQPDYYRFLGAMFDPEPARTPQDRRAIVDAPAPK